MNAAMVDLPAVAATCDSMSLIPEELAQSICNPDRLFPSANPNGHFSFGAAGPERDECVKLVLRQLQCGRQSCGERFSPWVTFSACQKPLLENSERFGMEQPFQKLQ